MPTTVLTMDKFKTDAIFNIRFPDMDTYSEALVTITEASIGYDRLELLIADDIIASTYGKYANQGVNLIQALLEEHKAERDRENRKAKK